MKKLFKLALLAGIGFGVYRLMEEKKNWMGLTETEARARLNDKLSPRVPADKLDRIADQIVAQMKERGVLRTETVFDGGATA